MTRFGSPLGALCRFLAPQDQLRRSDLLFVLAGRHERKLYGLRLFRKGWAPRLILSVGRFEVRQASGLGLEDEADLADLARSTPPEQRHFFLDLQGGSGHAVVRGLAGWGTFPELHALAEYLHAEPPQSLALVSTSIHLRRVRWCCERIPFYREKRVAYVAVPEELSSFHQAGWWKRPDHWVYLVREYLKLVAYAASYGKGEDKRSEPA